MGNRSSSKKKTTSHVTGGGQGEDLPATVAVMKSPDRPGKSRITSAITSLPATSVCLTPHELKICRTRVLKEYSLLRQDPSMPNVYIAMDPDNHLHWFCLIHSLQDNVFAGGEYIFHIALSPRYPFEAPDFYMYTPNGRFSLRTRLCFTNSSYHNESWSAIWSLKTLILGFLSFFLEKESQGAGHLNHVSEKEKEELAKKSPQYNEDHLADILALLRQENPDMLLASNTGKQPVEAVQVEDTTQVPFGAVSGSDSPLTKEVVEPSKVG